MRIKIATENPSHDEYRIDTDEDGMNNDDMEVGKVDAKAVAGPRGFHGQPEKRA